MSTPDPANALLRTGGASTPVPSTAMRPATTLALGLLLAAILVAGIVSLIRI
ncbi:MAG: hypothetical protein AAGG08_18240 [Actinomycetota bacterium]